MRSISGILFFSLVLAAGPSKADDRRFVTTKTTLISRGSLGVGGGPQSWFDFLPVCNPGQIKPVTVRIAMMRALSDLKLSTNPPNTDASLAVPLDSEWRTTKRLIETPLISQYNQESPEAKLSTSYIYFLSYRARVNLTGDELVLSTIPELSYGTSIKSSAEYTGLYESIFFHRLLFVDFSKQLRRVACNL